MRLFHSCDELPKRIGLHDYFGDFMFFSEYEQFSRGRRLFVIDLATPPNLIHTYIFCNYFESPADQAQIQSAIGKVKSVAARLGLKIDDEEAEGYLSQRQCLASHDESDGCDFGEAAWEIQRIGAELGVALGYDGVISPDELGESVMLYMHDERLAQMVEYVEEDA